MALKLPSFKLPSFKRARATPRGPIIPSGPGGLSSFAEMPTHKKLQLLGGVAAVSLLVALASAYLDYRKTSVGTRYIELSDKLLLLTQRAPKAAAQAVQGNQAAIDDLPVVKADMEQLLALLTNGGEGLPPTTGKPREALDKVLPSAQKTVTYIQEVMDGRPGILTVLAAANAVDQLNPLMRENVPELAVSGGVDNVRTTKFSLLMERLGKDVDAMLGAEVTTDEVAALGSDALEAEALLANFDKNRPAVAKVADLFETYRTSIQAIIAQVPQLIAAKRAVSQLYNITSVNQKGAFYVGASELSSAYADAIAGRWTTYLMITAAVILLGSLGLLARVYLEDARERASAAERASRKSQQAILLLMNEMSDLADGDLTVKATVTDDITGAIADAVNYTTDELRKLVSGVISASDRVADATGEAQVVAQELVHATETQAKDIRETGEAVALMTRSIQEVDKSATQSAQVARRTLEVTDQGTQAVRNAITGMDSIRDQIQETAKRIKRLGESSQEIGEIVDLIADITEQTNVLALNAAIQAAAAGEAGRGFSVVAEEVQRLAERSAEATKQISALVRTIQGDTQDAVAAMEQSTQGVVEGAKLSDVAGQSLREIEQVSHELADLIGSISVSTQVQTDMANEVATTMAEILRLTEQTTEGTKKTASSVADLANLAVDLKGSVHGFKL